MVFLTWHIRYNYTFATLEASAGYIYKPQENIFFHFICAILVDVIFNWFESLYSKLAF